MITIETEFPIATESMDHIFPGGSGTAQDNHTSLAFIEEIENFFNGRKIKMLDIGCAGGQFVIDLVNRGHTAIGIEGSDYSKIHQRANWPQYYQKNLFTADATKPYTIYKEDELGKSIVKFDIITAFEVFEHIHEKDFDVLFGNILKHMNENTILIAFIGLLEGPPYHVSVFTQDIWKVILWKYFYIFKYPFLNTIRPDCIKQSMAVMLKKRKEK